MRDFKKKYRCEFGKINPTKEQSAKMLSNILNHRKPNMYMRFAVISCSIIILCLFGITNANDIRKSFNSLYVNYKDNVDEDGNEYTELITHFDGVLEVNYDANLPEINSWVDAFEKNIKTFYTNYDLELILGVKFLKNDIFQLGYNINKLRKNEEDKISYVRLYSTYDKYEDEENYGLDDKLLEHVTLTAQFKTKYYQGGNDIDSIISGYYSVKNYYMNELDTTALIIKLNERGNHYIAVFSHNNVKYSFYYDNYEFPVDEDKVLQRIHEILDSFYY